MKKRSAAIFFGASFTAILFFGACERNITQVVEDRTPVNCFECHSDSDTRLVAAESQWEHSKHASGDNIDRNYYPCLQCHTSEGFVARVEGTTADASNPTVIHCFTCHAPHQNGDFTLRVTDPQPLLNGASFDLGDANICTACHHARYSVDTYVYEGVEFISHWGPHHSPQGDMIIGSNGYQFSGYNYNLISPHKWATEDGCLDCHFKTTRNNILGGHSFNMAYETEEGEEINPAGCQQCHGEDIEDFNIAYQGGSGIQDTVTTLLGELQTRLVTAGLIDAVDHEPIEDLVTSADSAGAVWNYLLVEEDRSEGVHNPMYIVDLLTSSIMFLDGTLPPASVANKSEQRISYKR
jgi:hypothetical protein